MLGLCAIIGVMVFAPIFKAPAPKNQELISEATDYQISKKDSDHHHKKDDKHHHKKDHKHHDHKKKKHHHHDHDKHHHHDHDRHHHHHRDDKGGRIWIE